MLFLQQDEGIRMTRLYSGAYTTVMDYMWQFELIWNTESL
jgi:hypothetical protein